MGMTGASREGVAALVYDSVCPACSEAVAWIRENSPEDAFELVPCGSETLTMRFPDLSEDECRRAMQLVLSDGTVLAGEEALPEVLARLRRYRSAGALFRLPGFPAITRVLYRWFAGNRYWIAKVLGHRARTGE